MGDNIRMCKEMGVKESLLTDDEIMYKSKFQSINETEFLIDQTCKMKNKGKRV